MHPNTLAPSSVIRHGAALIRPARNGRGFDCCFTDGENRHRTRLPDLDTARLWCESIQQKHLPPLTQGNIVDAQRAFARLPQGITLALIVDDYLKRNNLTSDHLFSTAIDAFLKDRADLSDITVRNYRQMLTRLAVFLDDPPLAAVTSADIERLLRRYKAVSRNTYTRHYAAFFTWCVQQEWLSESPIEKIRRPRTAEPPKGILTPQQAEALLRSAEASDRTLLPYLVLGLFAGIRPHELLRMSAENIKPKYLLLNASITKTTQSRTIPIRPNLAAWLKQYPAADRIDLGLKPRQLYVRLDRVASAAGVTIPRDGLRHSFATYAYEQCKDSALIASEMGHRGTDIFFRHYRALALPGDGEKYFSILPIENV